MKLPLGIAALAFAVGGFGLLLVRKNMWRTALVGAAAMIIFLQAARLALIRFDPYLGSYPLAQALKDSPPGQLIEGDAYYAFSSVFFYTNRMALLWNGRVNNLEYGSYAPGAPNVFTDDSGLKSVWSDPTRRYLLVYGSDLQHLKQLLGQDTMHVVKENAGNYLLTNQPLP